MAPREASRVSARAVWWGSLAGGALRKGTLSAERSLTAERLSRSVRGGGDREGHAVRGRGEGVVGLPVGDAVGVVVLLPGEVEPHALEDVEVGAKAPVEEG